MNAIGKLPAPIRHAVLLVLGVVIVPWALSSGVAALHGEVGWSVALGALDTALLAYVTPLVQSYGLGKVGTVV